jgi:DNA-binding response OmpR family regulator
MQQSIFDKKIIIVDDEVELLMLMETVLKKEGFSNIYKTTSGSNAVKMCKQINPDIILLDVMLPDMEGFDVCKEVRNFTNVPIIFLTAKSENFDKFLAFKLGADDYVTKPFSPKEVALRVMANLRRNSYVQKKEIIGDEIISCGNISVDIKKGNVVKNGKELIMTAKEFNLLLYFAENPNCILSKNLILLKVWGSDFAGYENSVMVYIRKLREKLEDEPSNPKLIKTVKGMGYKFCPNNR